MKRVVLTGGPCAGKTTTLNKLRCAFDNRIVIVPEAATMLLSSGFPVPGEEIEWSPEWQMEFQAAIFAVQKSMENVYTLLAQEQGASLVICDRGLLDGAAYTQGGLKAFCQVHNVDLPAVLARYEAVIHLESLAVGRPELYGKTSNEKRMESLEEARKLELAIRMIWSNHANYFFINSENTMTEKISKVIDIVETILLRET
ncbi:ATP-binding protein [Candidatus Poribacteria bacterium]|nr:ATP-binding protein [Candidatus Poribacteria bacterium]